MLRVGHLLHGFPPREVQNLRREPLQLTSHSRHLSTQDKLAPFLWN